MKKIYVVRYYNYDFIFASRELAQKFIDHKKADANHSLEIREIDVIYEVPCPIDCRSHFVDLEPEYDEVFKKNLKDILA